MIAHHSLSRHTTQRVRSRVSLNVILIGFLASPLNYALGNRLRVVWAEQRFPEGTPALTFVRFAPGPARYRRLTLCVTVQNVTR